MKKGSFWAWLWVVLGAIYFVLPLYATLDFSLRAKRGVLSLTSYASVLHNPRFLETFAFSVLCLLPPCTGVAANVTRLK